MFFIYDEDLDEARQLSIESQFTEESIAIFAEYHPGVIYFQAWLTTDDPDRPIDMNEVAIPQGWKPDVYASKVAAGDGFDVQSRFGTDEFAFIVGRMPGSIWQCIRNVWCYHPGVNEPYQPYFTEEELCDVAEEFPDRIFWIGGITGRNYRPHLGEKS